MYAAAAKSCQSCPTLCDPIDGSPPGSPIPGILQARTLEWVAISFSSAWMWKMKVKSLSGAWLLATPWTAAYQAPPSLGFSWQEYRSGLPLPYLNRNMDRGKKKMLFFLVAPCSMWYFSSCDQDKHMCPAVEACSPNHWTTNKITVILYTNLAKTCLERLGLLVISGL